MAFEKNVYEVVELPDWHDWNEWHSAVDVSFALQMIVGDTSARSAAMALWILNSQKTGDLCLAVKRFMRDVYIQRIGACPTKKDVKDALAQHFGKDEHSIIKAQVLNAHRQNFGEQYLDRTSKRRKRSTRV